MEAVNVFMGVAALVTSFTNSIQVAPPIVGVNEVTTCMVMSGPNKTQYMQCVKDADFDLCAATDTLFSKMSTSTLPLGFSAPDLHKSKCLPQDRAISAYQFRKTNPDLIACALDTKPGGTGPYTLTTPVETAVPTEPYNLYATKAIIHDLREGVSDRVGYCNVMWTKPTE